MQQFRYISAGGGKPPNPLVQILGFVVAAVTFGIMLLIGGIVLAALIGFVLLAAIVIYARVWWLQRKMPPVDRREYREQGETVDAEFRVIDITELDEDESERR